MTELRCSSRVPQAIGGIPYAPSGVDLRLDGNQGRAPGPDFVAQLGADRELLRSYPSDNGLERDLAARHGVGQDRIFCGAGADEVLDRLCRAVLEPGREAIVPVPTFEMLARYVALAGAGITQIPWDSGEWPRVAVLEAINPRTALVAIVSPNNPTGLVAVADDVRAVCRAARGAVVLVDAAYAEFGGEDLTAAALPFDNAVVVRTFSKAFGLAGLRVGYAVAAPQIVRWLRAVGSPFTCGTASRHAARVRLRTGTAEVAAFVERVRHEREELGTLLRDAGLQPQPSAGNFVYVRGVDASWLRDALLGLGIAVRAFVDGVRITMPAAEAPFARLCGAITSAVAPQALLLDLDGVLADIERRTALADPATLAALAQRLPIGVVTSCPRRLAESVLERHGFRAHVSALVTDEDGPGKPDPAPVRLLMQRLGARSAWLLGDNPGDVTAARGAGVVPLAIAPHGIGAMQHAAALREAGAARFVGGVAELDVLLAALPRLPRP